MLKSDILSRSVVQTGFNNENLIKENSIKENYLTQEHSSIYAQFKLETCHLLDEEGNLPELLKSYSKFCSETSQFLKEKLQNLNVNRQK